MDLGKMGAGEIIDALYALRAQRIDKQHEVDSLAAEEQRIKDFLISSMESAGLTRMAGRGASASISPKTVGRVVDWDAFTQHIAETGGFDLVERRVSSLAYRERLDAGQSVPGVEPVVVKNVNLTKIGG